MQAILLSCEEVAQCAEQLYENKLFWLQSQEDVVQYGPSVWVKSEVGDREKAKPN